MRLFNSNLAKTATGHNKLNDVIMKTPHLRFDKNIMTKVVSKNLLSRPTKTFTDYSYYGASCVSLAQSLRQRTLGYDREFTTEDFEKNPTGYFILRVESAHIRLANSLSETGTILALVSIGSENVDLIETASRRRSSQALGGIPTDSGTNTKGMSSDQKISAYISAHIEILQELEELHAVGEDRLRLCNEGEAFKEDFRHMLELLGEELKTANSLFGKPRWLFWKR